MRRFQSKIADLIMKEVGKDRSLYSPYSRYGKGFRTIQGLYLAVIPPRLREAFEQEFPGLSQSS